jgi:hypothetical protein
METPNWDFDILENYALNLTTTSALVTFPFITSYTLFISIGEAIHAKYFERGSGDDS